MGEVSSDKTHPLNVELNQCDKFKNHLAKEDIPAEKRKGLEDNLGKRISDILNEALTGNEKSGTKPDPDWLLKTTSQEALKSLIALIKNQEARKELNKELQDALSAISLKEQAKKGSTASFHSKLNQESSEELIVTPAMAAGLYKKVSELGLGNKLNGLNNSQTPDKFSKTLETLNIKADNIDFNGTNGYRVKLNHSQKIKLMKIADPDALLKLGVNALDQIDKQNFDVEMNPGTKSVPEKHIRVIASRGSPELKAIKKALDDLGISSINAYKGTSGFLVIKTENLDLPENFQKILSQKYKNILPQMQIEQKMESLGKYISDNIPSKFTANIDSRFSGIIDSEVKTLVISSKYPFALANLQEALKQSGFPCVFDMEKNNLHIDASNFDKHISLKQLRQIVNQYEELSHPKLESLHISPEMAGSLYKKLTDEGLYHKVEKLNNNVSNPKESKFYATLDNLGIKPTEMSYAKKGGYDIKATPDIINKIKEIHNNVKPKGPGS